MSYEITLLLRAIACVLLKVKFNSLCMKNMTLKWLVTQKLWCCLNALLVSNDTWDDWSDPIYPECLWAHSQRTKAVRNTVVTNKAACLTSRHNNCWPLKTVSRNQWRQGGGGLFGFQAPPQECSGVRRLMQNFMQQSPPPPPPILECESVDWLRKFHAFFQTLTCSISMIINPINQSIN